MDPRLDRFLAGQPKPFDQAVGDIDALLVRQASEREALLRQLEQQVRGLDEGEYSSSPLDEPMRPGEGPSSGQRPLPPPPAPQWQEPRRRTHGGPMGPKVREKLMREALGG